MSGPKEIENRVCVVMVSDLAPLSWSQNNVS